MQLVLLLLNAQLALANLHLLFKLPLVALLLASVRIPKLLLYQQLKTLAHARLVGLVLLLMIPLPLALPVLVTTSLLLLVRAHALHVVLVLRPRVISLVVIAGILVLVLKLGLLLPTNVLARLTSMEIPLL